MKYMIVRDDYAVWDGARFTDKSSHAKEFPTELDAVKEIESCALEQSSAIPAYSSQIEESLHARGFDLSSGSIVRCSQCAAVCVNGIPVHERGCPNEKHECRGCNALVPRNVRYCEDCAS